MRRTRQDWIFEGMQGIRRGSLGTEGSELCKVGTFALRSVLNKGGDWRSSGLAYCSVHPICKEEKSLKVLRKPAERGDQGTKRWDRFLPQRVCLNHVLGIKVHKRLSISDCFSIDFSKAEELRDFGNTRQLSLRGKIKTCLLQGCGLGRMCVSDRLLLPGEDNRLDSCSLS